MVLVLPGRPRAAGSTWTRGGGGGAGARTRCTAARTWTARGAWASPGPAAAGGSRRGWRSGTGSPAAAAARADPGNKGLVSIDS